MSERNTQSPPWQQSRRRRLVFHALAVVVVLSPLVLGELLLRLCVPRRPARPDDPYVTFRRQEPLFILDGTATRYETATDRLTAFRPQSFAAEKSARTVRVFCLGGSTVQGRPYSVETSFTTWLRLNLEAAQPATDWEVINVGGISYASYRLVPILRELLTHQPDLFIVYTGHNEFLEDRTYRDVKDMPGAPGRPAPYPAESAQLRAGRCVARGPTATPHADGPLARGTDQTRYGRGAGRLPARSDLATQHHHAFRAQPADHGRDGARRRRPADSGQPRLEPQGLPSLQVRVRRGIARSRPRTDRVSVGTSRCPELDGRL